MQSLRYGARHARRVEEVLSERDLASAMESQIRDSWRRCVTNHRLSPDRQLQPTVVTVAQLRERRERADPLYSIAQIEMAELARLLNAPVGIMLTDRDGVILDYTGEAGFAALARRNGLREGAIWSEAEQGTNGMGTCLAIREAVLIEGDAHFLSRNSALTCCGAPIVDGTGALQGVLNISGHLRLSAAPTVALVRLAVQNIENRALLAQHRAQHVLRFHPHREFIATAGEGIVAIDARGRVASANVAALQLLGISDHKSLCGHHMQSIFGLDLGRLEVLARDNLLARPLPRRERGALCYGVMQPPYADKRARSVPRNALLLAQRAAMREALECCDWNVSLAAKQLQISRRTLHRKLKLHGLQRYRSWESAPPTI